MAYNPVPTVATGDPWSAANHNTYVRDNFAAGVPDIFTAAGQIPYSTAADVAAVLAKPTVASVLKMLDTGVPSWLDLTTIPGILHTKGVANFTPNGQTFSGGWADITGATLTLTLGTTCTILALAAVTGYQGVTGRSFFIRALINGVADASPTNMFNGGQARNEALPYIYYATEVPSGARIVKLQCAADTDANHVERGRLIALAFAE